VHLVDLLVAMAIFGGVSAAMFTVSYCTAVVVSVVSGAAWDLGGSPRFAFLPVAVSALLLVFVPLTIRFRD